MRCKAIIHFLLIMLLFMGVGNGAEGTPALPTVELTTPIHFLSPAGEDVKVPVGSYQVEAAETWLKLFPEGKARSAVVLIEATQGAHEETLTEPVVRLGRDAENPDVFHLALLLNDGTGVEAVGTVSGVYTRSSRFAFLGRTTRSSQLGLAERRIAQRQPRTPPAPAADCGPYTKLVGDASSEEGRPGSPALVEFNNRLYVIVAVDKKRLHLVGKVYLIAFQYSGGQWSQIPGSIQGRINGEVRSLSSKGRVALANFQGALHMVYRAWASHDLWHTSTTSARDIRKWKTVQKIAGQKSKASPALAAFAGGLHMVHLGDTSYDLWHSVYTGSGWTINKNTGLKSWKTPALIVSPPNLGPSRLHIVFNIPVGGNQLQLLHSVYNGSSWYNTAKISGSFSKDATALAMSSDKGEPWIRLIHRGKFSNNLWHLKYGKNPYNRNNIEWFGNQRLLSQSSDAAPQVVRYKGCWHMVTKKDDEYRHITFSSSDVRSRN